MEIEPAVWDSIDVSHWPEVLVEPQGSEGAIWLVDETGEDTNPARWLHKDTVITASGNEQGEDWSEVVSTQVARLFGVPAAETRMCTRNGRRGSVSRSVLPDGWSLVDGSTWLQATPAVTGYVPRREGQPSIVPATQELQRPGHNLRNIKLALEAVAAPPQFDGPPALTGFDVFVGYLLVDAIVANRDRHEQNWAVLTPALGGDPSRLSPSFDHASSLGFQLTDQRRQRVLTSRDGLAKFAEKGTAWRFEHRSKRPPTLVTLAVEGLSMCPSEPAEFWRRRLRALELQSVLEPIRAGRITSMSDVAGTFVTRLLELNLRRLRDAASSAR